MNVNPISRLKRWLSAAIDWRVREEVMAEHEIVASLSKTVAHVSIEFTEKIRIQDELIEDLQKRVSALEREIRH